MKQIKCDHLRGDPDLCLAISEHDQRGRKEPLHGSTGSDV
jgi:hypothetical protein